MSYRDEHGVWVRPRAEMSVAVVAVVETAVATLVERSKPVFACRHFAYVAPIVAICAAPTPVGG